MHPGLINIGCSLKGCPVIFQHQHLFTLITAPFRRVQTIQTGSDYNFVIFSVHGDPLTYGISISYSV